MRFYGIQPSELAKLDGVTLAGLQKAAKSIAAREALEWSSMIGVAFGADDAQTEAEHREYRMNLAKLAFADDPAALAVALEAMTRKGV